MTNLNRCLAILLLALGTLTPVSTAMAQPAVKLALVIGNKAYKTEVGPLKNPHNDIKIVGSAIQASGFEVLTPLLDATRAQMLGAVSDFANQLQSAGPNAVGFLYYSGHGAAIRNQNYVIPIDVEKPDAASLANGGVQLSEIISLLVEAAPEALHYLVIDACRNNLGGSKGPKGFRPERRRDGMLVAFATEPDKPASDEGELSGPYASALAAELRKPQQIDLLLFHHVRVAVDQITNGEQKPWIEDGILRAERTYFGVPGPRHKPQEPILAWETLPQGAYLVNERGYTIYATSEPGGRDTIVDSIQHAARRPLKGADVAPLKIGKIKGSPKWYKYIDIKGRDAYVPADQITLK